MQNRAEDRIREANKAFLDSAWNFLNFHASEEDGEFYVDENLGEIEDYLYAGADANLVARSGIWVGHLPTVKLAFRFNVTENLIHHAFVNSTDEVIQYVLEQQIHFNIHDGTIRFCIANKNMAHRLFYLLKPTALKTDTGTIITSHIAKLPPHLVSALLVICLDRNPSEKYPSDIFHQFVVECLPYANLNSNEAYEQLFHAVMQYNHPQLIKPLLLAGASPLIADKARKITALDLDQFSLGEQLLSIIRKLLAHGHLCLSATQSQYLKDNYNTMLNTLLAFETKMERHHKMMIYINQGAVLTTALVERLFSYNQSDIAIPDNLFPESSTISLTAPMVIAAIKKVQPIHHLLSKYIKNTDAAILSEILKAIFQISQKLSATPELMETHGDYIAEQLNPFMEACLVHGAGIKVQKMPANNSSILVKLSKVSADNADLLTENSPYYAHPLVKHFLDTEITPEALAVHNEATVKTSIYTRLSLKRTLFAIENPNNLRAINRHDVRTQASLKLLHKHRVTIYILLRAASQEGSRITPSVILIIAAYLIDDHEKREKCFLRYNQIVKSKPGMFFIEKSSAKAVPVTEPENTLILKK